MDIRLSKLDVARRQLVTAIRLFFDSEDPVSVFTLAANSWEVIDALCDKSDVDSICNESREHTPEGKDLKTDYINSPFRNFFKHADRDPEDQLDGFDEKKCDGVIFLAVEDYMRLTGKSPLEFQVFQLWYLAVYLEKVSDDALERIVESTEHEFPNIRSLSREEQVLQGRNSLEHAMADTALLNDHRTERPF